MSANEMGLRKTKRREGPTALGKVQRMLHLEPCIPTNNIQLRTSGQPNVSQASVKHSAIFSSSSLLKKISKRRNRMQKKEGTERCYLLGRVDWVIPAILDPSSSV